jgi:hypothetical protein
MRHTQTPRVLGAMGGCVSDAERQTRKIGLTRCKRGGVEIRVVLTEETA